MRALITIVCLVALTALSAWIYETPEERVRRLGPNSNWDKPPLDMYYEAELRSMKEHALCYDLLFTDDPAYTLILPDGRSFMVLTTDPMVVEHASRQYDSIGMRPVYQMMDQGFEPEAETFDSLPEGHFCFTK